MINQNQPTATFWKFGNEDNGQGVGYNDTEGPVSHKRLMYMFDTGGLGNMTIQKATMRAYEVWSYSCTETPVEAWWSDDISSSTSWSTRPTWHFKVDTQTVAYGRSGCTPGGAWVPFNVKDALTSSLKNKRRYTTVGLKATDETTNAGWKRFYNNATLTIDYNHPPAVPSGLAFKDPNASCGVGRSSERAARRGRGRTGPAGRDCRHGPGPGSAGRPEGTPGPGEERGPASDRARCLPE